MDNEALIIRVIPSKPVTADTFQSVLSTLEIEVYDVSIGDSRNGTLIAVAEGLLDINAIVIEIINEPASARRLGKGIWQHWELPPQHPPGLPIDSTNAIYFPVASAIVLINRPTRFEYGSYDLKLKITRKGSLALSSKIEYNASPLVNIRFDPPLTERQLDPFKLPGAAYVCVPAVDLSNFDPDNSAISDVEGSGQPWEFTALVKAVNTVLTQDRQSTDDAELSKLEKR
ncbi:hypothetical protein BJX99DRAFT_265143 [Aspergillus californicus]